MKKYVLILLITVSTATYGQIKMDARTLGLAGTGTTINRGIYAVGWNPANLGFYDPKDPVMISLGTVHLKFDNSSLSLTNLNKFNGLDLEEINPYTNQTYKTEFMDIFPATGWDIYAHSNISMPIVSISNKNIAYTNDIVFISDFTIPRSIFEILFQGNQINKDYDMTLKVDVLSVMMHRFSIAFPSEQGSFGATLTYLQGLTYMGIDPDSSSSYFITNPDKLQAHGEYITRQTVGGNGIGLDLGYTTRESDGWQFSIAINNLFANIEWNKPTYTYNLLSSLKLTNRDRASYQRNWYDIHELRPTDLLATGNSQQDSTQTPEIFSSGDSTIDASSQAFGIKYPAVFRMGLLHRLNEDVTWVLDVRTGFEDRFFALPVWIWSTGLEIVRTPAFPIRVGTAFGGRGYRMMSFGFSVRKSIFSIDFGMAFTGGFTASTAKGLEMSLGGHIIL